MTDAQQWNAVDQYLVETLIPHDDALDAALQASDAADLPAIQVSATQGMLLHILARATGAKRILEIGTLGGYSTLWLARGLPADGGIVTLELDPKHAAVAQANFAQAGVADQIELRVGVALESLAALYAEAVAPFDMVFIDADKPNNPGYLQWALKLTHPGSLIITDNVIRHGEIANAASVDDKVQGTRTMFAALGANAGLTATAIQTVGSKGYDGFSIALVG